MKEKQVVGASNAGIDGRDQLDILGDELRCPQRARGSLHVESTRQVRAPSPLNVRLPPMSWFAAHPQKGDWVKTTRPIKTSLLDHLSSSDAGVKPGARGVVLDTSGWNVVHVRLSAGLFGSVTVRTTARHLRVIRRGGGVQEFDDFSGRVNAMRAGVAIALIAPFAYFIATWFLHGGSKEGLIPALIDGGINGALDVLSYGVSNPVNAAIYLLVLTAAGRFAFR